MEKKKKNIARAARAARRRRAAGAERRRAALRRLSRYPFCASFQFLRGSTLPAALAMSMPLGTRRPRGGVRPGERCAAAAQRRAGDDHLRVRPLVEDADVAPDALTRDGVSTAAPRRRRPSACVRELAETLKTSRTHATYSSMSTDGRRVRRSRSSRSARPTSTQRTLYGCRSPAGRTDGRYDRRARHVNRAALDVRVDHDACGVHASRGRDARVEGARVLHHVGVARRRATHRRSCRTVHIFRPGHPS